MECGGWKVSPVLNPLWSYLAIPSVTYFLYIFSGAARGKCDLTHCVAVNWYYEISLPPGGIKSAANQKLKCHLLRFLFLLVIIYLKISIQSFKVYWSHLK